MLFRFSFSPWCITLKPPAASLFKLKPTELVIIIIADKLLLLLLLLLLYYHPLNSEVTAKLLMTKYAVAKHYSEYSPKRHCYR